MAGAGLAAWENPSPGEHERTNYWQESISGHVKSRCHKLPLRGPPLRDLREGGDTGVMNARTNIIRRMCGSIRARMCS